jgi:hypothetical protein
MIIKFGKDKENLSDATCFWDLFSHDFSWPFFRDFIISHGLAGGNRNIQSNNNNHNKRKNSAVVPHCWPIYHGVFPVCLFYTGWPEALANFSG